MNEEAFNKAHIAFVNSELTSSSLAHRLAVFLDTYMEGLVRDVGQEYEFTDLEGTRILAFRHNGSSVVLTRVFHEPLHGFWSDGGIHGQKIISIQERFTHFILLSDLPQPKEG